MSVASQPAAEIRPASWFRRNWKWFLPGLFVVTVVMGAVAIFGYVQVRSNGYRQNPAYQLALDVVQSSEEVQERLGAPIEDSDWNPQGRYEREGDTIRGAGFNFTVSGPQGSADVAVQASLIGGEWAVNGLHVRFADQQLDLTQQVLAKQKIDTPEFDRQAEDHRQGDKQTEATEPGPQLNVDVPEVPPGIK